MNQREAVAAFYGIASIAAVVLVLLITFPTFSLILFCVAILSLTFVGLILKLQADKERVKQEKKEERLREERLRGERRKQALFESIQRDRDSLENLKRARGETWY